MTEQEGKYNVSMSGDISEKLKEEIERLSEYYDPVKEAQSQGLLLPLSCAPKIEEVIELSLETISQVASQVIRAIEHSKAGDVIGLDVTDIRICGVIEAVLTEYKQQLEEKKLKLKITNRMREALLEFQRQQLEKMVDSN